MFGNNDELIKLLKQWRKEDLERIQRERDENLARYTQWREEDRQAAKERNEQDIAYARERDAEQTRLMQAHLATFQEKLAIEKALIQAAQPIDKQAIHNEVERDRKAAARANNKKNANTNATTEETTTNG